MSSKEKKNAPNPGTARLIFEVDGKSFQFEFDQALAGTVIQTVSYVLDQRLEDLKEQTSKVYGDSKRPLKVAHRVDDDYEGFGPAKKKGSDDQSNRSVPFYKRFLTSYH